jgi:hypothetical protein
MGRVSGIYSDKVRTKMPEGQVSGVRKKRCLMSGSCLASDQRVSGELLRRNLP